MAIRIKGFALTELAILIIAGILISTVSAIIAICLYIYYVDEPKVIHRVSCVEGHKFTVGTKGLLYQILDKDGHGVPCDN